MKRLSWVLGLMVLLVTAMANASVIDAPHNETNHIMCGSCHTYSLWWKYSPTTNNELKSHTGIVDAVCATCHAGGGLGPKAVAHTATTTYTPPWLGEGCTVCHDPHYQGQLTYAPADANAYLVTGHITSVLTDTPTAGLSTINYTIGLPVDGDKSNANWPAVGTLPSGTTPAGFDWSNKSVNNPETTTTPGRGLILVHDKALKSNSFNIVSATASQVVVRGFLDPVEADIANCVDGTCNTFGLIYGQLIKDTISAKPVKFFDPNGGFVGNGTDTPGLCQVCHTRTIRYTTVVNGAVTEAKFPVESDSHFGREGMNCVSCHKHDGGFKGTGSHDNTSFKWAGNCATCHNPAGTITNIVEQIHGNTCGLCHVSAQGGGTRQDGPASYGVDGTALGATNNSTCLDCHISATRTGGFIHHDTPGGWAAANDCIHCHENAAGKLAADHSSKIQPGIGCTPCHSGTIGASTGAPVDPANPKVHDACTSCHENTGALKSITATGGSAPISAGTCVNCHGNYFPTHTKADHSSRVGADLNCTSCHTATAGNATLVPVDAGSDDPKVHDACVSCHDATTNALKTVTAPGGSAPISAGTCTTCHSNYFASHTHSHVDVVKVQTSPNPTGLNCLTSGCHTATTTPFTGATEVHAVGCATCHDTANHNLLKTIVPAGGGECSVCHNTLLSPQHQTGTAHTITPPDSSCGTASCHPTKVSSPATSHVACTTCHQSTDANVKAAIANPNPVTCLVCHTDHSATAHGITAPVVAGVVCAECHAAKVASAEGNHGGCNTCHASTRQAVIDVIANHTLPDSTVTCASCHSPLSGQHVANPNHPITAPVSGLACIDCHAAKVANAVSGHGTCAKCHTSTRTEVTAAIAAKVSATCTTCHPTLTGQHAPGTHPITAPTVTGLPCADCHSAKVANAATAHTTCLVCHSSTVRADVQTVVAAKQAVDCSACHALSAQHTSPSHPITAPTGGLTCSECHGAKVANAATGHANCAVCHQATRTPVPATIAAKSSSTCTTCHAPLSGNHVDVNLHQISAPTGGLTCADCHSAEVANAATGHTDCITCHQSSRTEVTTTITNNAASTCSNCHATLSGNHVNVNLHQISAPTGGLTCSDCHAAKVTNAATGHTNCNVCHQSTRTEVKNTISANVASTCINCHTLDAQHVAEPSHPITAADVNGLHCADCHGSKVTNAATAHANCATCHQSTNPLVTGAISNWKTQNATCSTCHLTLDAQHAATPNHPITAADVNGLHCADCHGTKVTNAATGHATCSTCHQSTNPVVSGAISNWKTADATCSTCHTTLDAQHVAAPSHPITAVDVNTLHCADCHGTKVTNAATGHTNCATCHQSTRTEVSGAISNWKTQDATCSTCHSTLNAQHVAAPVHPITPPDSSCATCHPTKVANAATNHTSCATCHQSTTTAVSTAIANRQAVTCMACHTVHSAHQIGVPTGGLVCADCHAAKVASAENNHGGCDTCHADTVRADVKAVIAGHTMPDPTVTCASCHASLDAQHVAAPSHPINAPSGSPVCADCHAAKVTNSATGHATCVVCHQSTRSNVVSTIAAKATSTCTNCHATLSAAHTGTHLITAQTENGLTCSQCHAAKVTNAATGHTACTTCHSSTRTAVVNAIAAKVAVTCSTCHVPLSAQHTLTPNHPVTAQVVNGLTCANCHANKVTNAASGHAACITCHQSTKPVVVAAIAAKAASTCSTCHTTLSTRHNSADATHPITASPTGLACAECHAAKVANSATGHVACTTCHASTTPAVVTAIANKVAVTCTACHVSHNTVSVHDKFSISAGCSSCHGTLGNMNDVVTLHTKANDGCVTCHQSTRAAVVTAIAAGKGLAGTTQTCASCHTAHNTEVDHNFRSIAWGTGPKVCSDCHSSDTSNGVGNKGSGTLASKADVDALHNRKAGAGTTSCDLCHKYNAATMANSEGLPLQTTVETAIANGKLGSVDATCVICHGYNQDANHGGHPVPDTIARKGGDCVKCHDNNSYAVKAVVADIHKNNCTDCHTSPPVLKTHTPVLFAGATCVDCHTATYGHTVSNPTHSKIKYGFTQVETSCTSCHNTNIMTEHITVRGYSCSICHQATPYEGVITTAMGSPSATVLCSACHADQDASHAGHNHKIDANLDCGGCHNAVDVTTGIHVTNTCTVCHNSTNATVIAAIAAGKAGTRQQCSSCHGSRYMHTTKLAGVHKAVNVDANQNCAKCHAANLTAFASFNELVDLHRNSCETCHSSRTSVTATGVAHNCSFCHTFITTPGTDSYHHTTSLHTAAGECEYCHADPRLAAPNTGYTKPTGFTAPPTHLACEECHVQPKAAAGTGSIVNTRTNGWTATAGNMTVYAFDKGSDTKKTAATWKTAPARTVVHTIPNTAQKINTWGICLGCHDGSHSVVIGGTLKAAVQVKPQHAMPTTINSNQNYCGASTSSFGYGAFLPGRGVYSNVSNINYFAGLFRATKTKPSTTTQYSTAWGSSKCGDSGGTKDYTKETRALGRTYDDGTSGTTGMPTTAATPTTKGQMTIPNPWSGGSFSNTKYGTYTGFINQMPVFASQTATKANDKVVITEAWWMDDDGVAGGSGVMRVAATSTKAGSVLTLTGYTALTANANDYTGSFAMTAKPASITVTITTGGTGSASYTLVAEDDRTCYTCGSGGGTGGAKIHPAGHESQNANPSCSTASCHGVSGDLPTVHKPGTSCTQCHGAFDAAGNDTPGTATPKAINDWIANPANTDSFGASTTMATVIAQGMANNAKVTCKTCHQGDHSAGHDMPRFNAAAGLTCTDCHAQQAADPGNPDIANDHVNRLNTSGVAMTCDTCHANAALTTIINNGKAGTQVFCSDCHNGTLAPLYQTNHAAHDTRVAGNGACTGCHTATAGTSSGIPLDASATEAGHKVHDTCSTCHSANGTLKAAYGKATAMVAGDCVSCHGNYFESHTHGHDVAFVSASDLSQDAPGTACYVCHDDAGLGKGTVALSTWAAIKLEHDLDGTKDGIGACATCHSYTNADGKASPPLATTQSAISTGVGVHCVTCHTEKVTPAKHGGHTATQFAGSPECTGCHTVGVLGIVEGIHNNLCTTCHTTMAGGTGTTIVGSATNGIDGNAQLGISAAPHSGVTCLTCHPVATYPAKAIHHDTGHAVSQDCVYCHVQSGSHAGDHSARVNSNVDCLNCHTSTAGTTTGILVDAVDNKVHDNCMTCHQLVAGVISANATTTKAPLRPIGGGDCTACHGAYMPNHTHTHVVALQTTDKSQAGNFSCNHCHDDAGLGKDTNALSTWAAIYTEHKSDCTKCHSSSRTEVITAISAKVNPTGCLNCHSSKTAPATHGGHTATDFGWTTATKASCGVATCHDWSTNADVVKNVHSNLCTFCHTSMNGGDGTTILGVRNNGDARRGDTTSPHASDCIACHNNGTTIFTGGIHHDTTYAANNDCVHCHTATTAVANHSATVTYGTTGCNAASCHGTATAGTSTGIQVSPTDGLVHDACRSCHTFDANLSGKLRVVGTDIVSGTNGVTAMPNGGDDSRVDVTPNGGPLCTSCHTALKSAIHHGNANALAGACEHCHNDPRLATPNTGYTKPSGFTAPPTHLACEECHIQPKAAAGTGSIVNTRTNGWTATAGNMTVYAFDKGTETKKTAATWKTAPVRTVVHTIPNTAQKINTYGICLGCHDGAHTVNSVLAPKVNPQHAMPTTINSNQNYCGAATSSFGYGAFLPGRGVYSNVSNINYFAGLFRATKTKPSTTTQYSTAWGSSKCGDSGGTKDYTKETRALGRTYDDGASGTTGMPTTAATPTTKGQMTIPNPWSGGSFSNTKYGTYTGFINQMPVFASQTAAAQVTYNAEVVTVTSATIVGANLVVVASSSTQANCSTLTLKYGATGSSSFGTSCTKTVPYTYPTDGLTIDVVSSATPSVAVMEYPVSGVVATVPASAVNDTFAVPATGLTNLLPMANDSGTGISITGVTQPTLGTVAISGGASINYTGAGAGTTSFTYTITASDASISTATVNLTMVANGAPVFGAASYTAANATVAQAYSSTVAQDATDPESDPITYSRNGGTCGTWATVATNGAISGTPATGDVGTCTVIVQATATGGSDTAPVTITVAAAATSTNYEYHMNTGTGTSVGTNGSDNLGTGSAGDSLTATSATNEYRDLAQQTAVGSGTESGTTRNRIRSTDVFSGTWEYARVYTPAYGAATTIAANATARVSAYLANAATSGDYVKVDIYEYNNSTGFVGSAKGTATVNMANTTSSQQVNLTLNNPQFTVASGNRVVLVISFTDNGNGRPALLWGSTFSTTPSGPTYFTLGEGTSANPTNQPPAFGAASYTAANATVGQAYSSTVAQDATDPESDPITYSRNGGTCGTWATVSSAGLISGTPAAGDVGTCTVIAQATATGGSDTAPVTITVGSGGGTPVSKTYFMTFNSGTSLTQPSGTSTNTTCPSSSDTSLGSVAGVGLLNDTDSSTCVPVSNRDVTWSAASNLSLYYNGAGYATAMNVTGTSVVIRARAQSSSTLSVRLFYTNGSGAKTYFTGSAVTQVLTTTRTLYTLALTGQSAASIPAGSRVGIEFAFSGAGIRAAVNAADFASESLILSETAL